MLGVNGAGQRRNLSSVSAVASSATPAFSRTPHKSSANMQNVSMQSPSEGSAAGTDGDASSPSHSLSSPSVHTENPSSNTTYQQGIANSNSSATSANRDDAQSSSAPRKPNQSVKKVMATSLNSSSGVSESDIDRTIGMVEVSESETNKTLEAHKIKNITTDHHTYYNSTMYVNEKEVADAWETVKNIPPSQMLSQSHRRAMVSHKKKKDRERERGRFQCEQNTYPLTYLYIVDRWIILRLPILRSSGTKCDGGQWRLHLHRWLCTFLASRHSIHSAIDGQFRYKALHWLIRPFRRYG